MVLILFAVVFAFKQLLRNQSDQFRCGSF